ncbi:hypothetical protein D6774_03415 [Candidatus Woesearchaeota archaeon]|nr:MAG: hypothetical protein D6774_03415 [Candidatus Woesearchaeota archaeon]
MFIYVTKKKISAMGQNNINIALEHAKNYLLQQQNTNGSWTYENAVNIQGPEHLHRPLFLTSMALNTLLLIAPRNTAAISRAIHYVSEQKIDENDHVDLLASQLWGIKAGNTRRLEEKKEELLNLILKRRSPEGIWREFSGASNLTLYGVMLGIRDLVEDSIYAPLRAWLLTHKAQDGIGWGLHENFESTQVSFSTNAMLTLLYAGEDPLNKDIQQAKEFLLSSHLTSEGGWPSSALTIPKESTTYGTALTIITLLHTHEDLQDERVKKGISWLLETQLPNGSWPLRRDGQGGEYYTTYYAVKALRYYQYLQEQLTKHEVRVLLKHVEHPCYLARYLFRMHDLEMLAHYRNSFGFDLLERSLATTEAATQRRKTILDILSSHSALDCAQVLDALKEFNTYKHLNKRSHLAQIKNDLDALVKLGLVHEHRRRYFLVRKI